MSDKVKEAYDKYKHLDELLSDKEFLDEKNIRAMILYDLWQAVKEPSPTVTPERLAEIVVDCTLKAVCAKIDHADIPSFIATELSKTLDIREKEQPCCDSPGKEKCMQCQELDRRD